MFDHTELIWHSLAAGNLFTANGIPSWAYLGPLVGMGLAFICLYAYFDRADEPARRRGRLTSLVGALLFALPSGLFLWFLLAV